MIAFTGLAGSGKDTAADYLVQAYGYSKLALADPIKEMIALMLGQPVRRWTDRQWKEEVIEELWASPRRMAQTLGTEWGRNTIHPKLWLHILTRRVENKYPAKTRLIVSDVRFNNEALYLKQRHEAMIVQIVGRSASGIPDHPSEHGVDVSLIDYVVDNSGSPNDLFKQLDTIVTKWYPYRLPAEGGDAH